MYCLKLHRHYTTIFKFADIFNYVLGKKLGENVKNSNIKSKTKKKKNELQLHTA